MKNFIKQIQITEDQFYGRKKIYGNLYLNSLKTIPEGFNPTVGGYLYLGSLETIPEEFNPTVGGNLDLSSLKTIPEGFNPTVGGYLYLSSLKTIPEGFNPTVGGGLDLSSLKTIPEGFNPTVGRGLYLGSLETIPEEFNPTVGSDLYLGSLETIPEEFNPTVGGDLYLESLKTIPEGFDKNSFIKKMDIITWDNGYVLIDGIFAKVISKKKNVYKLQKIASDNYFYAINSNGKWSHGNTIEEAKRDLIYKISNRDKSSFSKYTLKTVLNLEDAIECYRVITGACSYGVKSFVETKLNGKLKDKYSIKEIINMTKDEYGGKEFERYFSK